MLSITLRSLVRDGLVARRVEPTVPPAVHYRLTELGSSLEGPLSALQVWAETHMPEIDRSNQLADELPPGQPSTESAGHSRSLMAATRPVAL